MPSTRLSEPTRGRKENAMSEECAHCGEPAQGYATVKQVRVCYPQSKSERPDCYRRVTVYQEPLGILKTIPDKPPGVTHIIDGWMAWLEQLDLGMETTATVCVTHKRFLPCRVNTRECVISVRPADVERVRKYQRAEEEEDSRARHSPGGE